MKKSICYIRIIILFLWYYFKSNLKRLIQRLFSPRMFIIFICVVLVMSCEVWVPYLIYFIFHDKWWLGIGSACWAFWLGPFTPFLELCLLITFGIDKLWRKIYAKIRN